MSLTTPLLLVSLSGISRLARVQRPVVSAWRSRSAGTATPFPEARGLESGRERFDVVEVAEWLVATGRGNNPDPRGDAAAHALLEGIDPADTASFDSLTALVALRAASDCPLSTLDADEVIDLADALDADDLMLFSEIESLGRKAPALCGFVDVLSDSAYGPAAAFENLIAERARTVVGPDSSAALSPAATALIVAAVLELAVSIPDADPESPRFNDPSGTSTDLLTALIVAAPEHLDLDVSSAGTSQAARFARRRLRAHGIDARPAALTGFVVHLAQFLGHSPAHGPRAATHAVEVASLEAIESLIEGMDDTERAVVIAPASLLCDGDLDETAATVRSQILRLGRVRAIVRLPRGLVGTRPRQALALWALGPAHESVPIAERWTMLADLSERELGATTRLELVGDLAAAMGSLTAVAAHSFRFARNVRTSALLARSGSFFASTQPVKHGQTDAAPNASLAVQLDEALARLGEDALLAGATPNAVDHPARLDLARLGTLAADGHVRCLSGTRLAQDHLSTRSGFRVIAAVDVAAANSTAEQVVPAHTIDRLLLAATYPGARLTEPGDIVFVTSPTPCAIVDTEGSAVVSYPARILRINASDPAGLMPEVLAADLAALRGRDWRNVVARRVLAGEKAGLARALAAIREAQDAARTRLAHLERLSTLLLAGVTSGTVTLSTTSPSTTPLSTAP